MTNIDRREFLGITASGLVALAFPSITLPGRLSAQGPQIIDHLSPRVKTRPNREDTKYIILHTTEAPRESSLNSLTEGGKANYMVDTNGKTYRIVKDAQLSNGSGRSMWNGISNLSDHAVNIEFVGYAKSPLTSKQNDAGKKLIKYLESKYHIVDRNVLTHSQVAYANPNRYYKSRHRGRKWDALQLARGKGRENLGLYDQWKFDPDVRAGRLAIGPTELSDILYGDGVVASSQDSMNVRIGRAKTVEEFESDSVFTTLKRGQKVQDIAGNDYANETTIYFLPDGRVRMGDELKKDKFNFANVQPGTKMAVGYVYGGHVKPDRSALSIAGRRWSAPETIYRFPDGTIVNGDDVNQKLIPKETIVIFKK